MMVEIDAKWRVCLEARFDLPVPAPLAWRELSDFECFACQDLFHSQVLLDGQVPATGAGFSLRHSLLGIGFERVGRILSWHEGQGYGFSDLSQRDTKKGFPHTYFYRIKPVDQKACQIELAVRGLWTARYLPRFLVRVWLGLILLKIRISMETTLLCRLFRSAH